MSQSTKPAGGKPRRSLKKDSLNLFKDGFNWDKYLQVCNLPAAPRECFAQSQDDILVNKFKIEHKIEAQDPRNPTSICLATVVALQGPRILIRLDGGDACNDFWRSIDAGDIYPLGTHEAKGTPLQPPLGFTKNMSTWTSFLAKNREKGEKAGNECFEVEPSLPNMNLFEVGMKLEAVDRKNPDLICPATIGDINGDQVFISFDGWRGAMDYWCHYTSRDLFPVDWCKENDHPLTSPGNKGDNPTVVERLKLVADKLRRKTRSVAGISQDCEKITTKIRPETPTFSSQSRGRMREAEATRGRMRGRPVRSLTPVSKMLERKTETENIKPESAIISDNIASTESSAESETCDSSASSHESSGSSSSDNEEAGDDGTKEEESGNSEIDESVVEVKQPASTECDAGISPEHKKKKGGKRLKELHKHKSLATKAYGERKRHASAGDEDHYAVKMKHRRKYKRKHSGSSTYESPQKRILGFGNQASNLSTVTAQGSELQSPSFFDHDGTPTSLFGLSHDEIVKKATEGWPSRLMGNSKMVVTSDNKLARFGQNIADNACQASEITLDENLDANQSNAPVSPTVSAPETPTVSAPETPTIPNATTPERTPKISSQTVSSTTNLPQQTTQEKAEIIIPQSPENTSPTIAILPRQQRSRNPQRWTVRDVIDYVREREPALSPYVHLFRSHEIDGQALLLLNSSIAVKYMNMKLGPALKLANLVEQLKKLVPPPRSEL